MTCRPSHVVDRNGWMNGRVGRIIGIQLVSKVRLRGPWCESRLRALGNVQGERQVGTALFGQTNRAAEEFFLGAVGAR